MILLHGEELIKFSLECQSFSLSHDISKGQVLLKSLEETFMVRELLL